MIGPTNMAAISAIGSRTSPPRLTLDEREDDVLESSSPFSGATLASSGGVNRLVDERQDEEASNRHRDPSEERYVQARSLPLYCSRTS